ncbi:MAG: N-6 DNA methylase, partial [Eubacteriaceae bacterium]
SDANIEKIIKTYQDRQDVEKYAHLASLEEMVENDYNLNIPRYVDTFEEEEAIDLDEVNRLLKEDDIAIAKLEEEINEQLRLLGVEV